MFAIDETNSNLTFSRKTEALLQNQISSSEAPHKLDLKHLEEIIATSLSTKLAYKSLNNE